MGGGLESRCVGRVCGADGETSATATQHLMLLMMGVCARNMSSQEYINKNYNIFASSWHFTLFYEEDAGSDNLEVKYLQVPIASAAIGVCKIFRNQRNNFIRAIYNEYLAVYLFRYNFQ